MANLSYGPTHPQQPVSTTPHIFSANPPRVNRNSHILSCAKSTLIARLKWISFLFSLLCVWLTECLFADDWCPIAAVRPIFVVNIFVCAVRHFSRVFATPLVSNCYSTPNFRREHRLLCSSSLCSSLVLFTPEPVHLLHKWKSNEWLLVPVTVALAGASQIRAAISTFTFSPWNSNPESNKSTTSVRNWSRLKSVLLFSAFE